MKPRRLTSPVSSERKLPQSNSSVPKITTPLLSHALQLPQKANFINEEQVTLNYCGIEQIDSQVPKKFRKIMKLHLSHNKLTSLINLQQFPSLINLAVAFNQIETYEELQHVENPLMLRYLRVKGNPLEKHPNYKVLLLERFTNLERLDDLRITPVLRTAINRETRTISRNLITFLYFLRRESDELERLVERAQLQAELLQKQNKINVEAVLKSSKMAEEDQEIRKQIVKAGVDLSLYDFSRVEVIKSLCTGTSFRKRDLRTILSTLSKITTEIFGEAEKMYVEESRHVFYDIYKDLFNKILLKYNGKYDKNFEVFLLERVLKNPKVDFLRFSEDNAYAAECMLFEFYRVMPMQAHISDITCFDPADRAENNRNAGNVCSDRGAKAKQKHPKSEYDVDNCDPAVLQSLFLAHFPVFPLNQTYMEAILDVLRDKMLYLTRVYEEVLSHSRKTENGASSIRYPRFRPVGISPQSSLSRSPSASKKTEEVYNNYTKIASSKKNNASSDEDNSMARSLSAQKERRLRPYNPAGLPKKSENQRGRSSSNENSNMNNVSTAADKFTQTILNTSGQDVLRRDRERSTSAKKKHCDREVECQTIKMIDRGSSATKLPEENLIEFENDNKFLASPLLTYSNQSRMHNIEKRERATEDMVYLLRRIFNRNNRLIKETFFDCLLKIRENFKIKKRAATSIFRSLERAVLSRGKTAFWGELRDFVELERRLDDFALQKKLGLFKRWRANSVLQAERIRRHYERRLKIKVLYGLVNFNFQRRRILGKIVQRLGKDQKKISEFFFRKWKIISTSMKVLSKIKRKSFIDDEEEDEFTQGDRETALKSRNNQYSFNTSYNNATKQLYRRTSKDFNNTINNSFLSYKTRGGSGKKSGLCCHKCLFRKCMACCPDYF